MNMPQSQFITRYKFHKDETRPNRVLESVRVGGVYISRIIIKPKAIIGNIYRTKTNAVYFSQIGCVQMKFVQKDTLEEKEFRLGPDDGIIHLPPNVAFAIRNLRDEESVMVAFSDRPLFDHSDDEVFEVLK